MVQERYKKDSLTFSILSGSSATAAERGDGPVPVVVTFSILSGSSATAAQNARR